MSGASVEELVARAQAGDARALEALLSQSRPALERLSRRVCPPQDIEDAVQEVLLRASSQIGALRVARAFVAWSARMLVRQCHMWKERALRSVLGGSEPEVAAPRSALDLTRGFGLLSPEARDILFLRDVLGHSGPEAAEALGISLESTKSRLRRARADLRLALEEA